MAKEKKYTIIACTSQGVHVDYSDRIPESYVEGKEQGGYIWTRKGDTFYHKPADGRINHTPWNMAPGEGYIAES